MTLAADIVDADLTTMFTDWGDTAVSGGVTYTGMYDKEYLESLNMEGSSLAFIGKLTEMGAIAQGATLAITSELHSISAVNHRVEKVQKNPPAYGPGTVAFVVTLL